MKTLLVCMIALMFLAGTASAEIEVDRIYGDDRYETAVEISKETWDTADTVVIATGQDYPDALAGAPLAYAKEAPILLTRSSDLPRVTENEINRLGARKAVILGGTTAVEHKVERQLQDAGLTTERLAGDNRYSTAVEIYEKLQGKIDTDEVILASGTRHIDALQVGPYAAYEEKPILLTRENELVPEASNAIFNNISTVYPVGNRGIDEAVVRHILGNCRDKIMTKFEKIEEFDEVRSKSAFNYFKDRNATNIRMWVMDFSEYDLLRDSEGSIEGRLNWIIDKLKEGEFNDIAKIIEQKKAETNTEIDDALDAEGFRLSRMNIRNELDGIRVEHCIVVRNDDFADALTGTVLGAQLNKDYGNTVIMPTHPGVINPDLGEFFNDESSLDITMLGGYNAISKQVENEIGNFEMTVDHLDALHGEDRVYIRVKEKAELPVDLEHVEDFIIGDSTKKLAHELKGNTERETLSNVYNWVTENISYDYDLYRKMENSQSTNTVKHFPEKVLERRKGVCSGFAGLTQALLAINGIEAYYIMGNVYNFGEVSGHAWNEAVIDGKTYYIDTTWGEGRKGEPYLLNCKDTMELYHWHVPSRP